MAFLRSSIALWWGLIPCETVATKGYGPLLVKQITRSTPLGGLFWLQFWKNVPTFVYPRFGASVQTFPSRAQCLLEPSFKQDYICIIKPSQDNGHQNKEGSFSHSSHVWRKRASWDLEQASKSDSDKKGIASDTFSDGSFFLSLFLSAALAFYWYIHVVRYTFKYIVCMYGEC